MPESLYARHLWSPAQIRALAELAELHPGEPMSTDTFANPGRGGLMSVRAGDAGYVLSEDGRIIDAADGELIDAAVAV